jgi:hypothetical protein
VVAREERVEHFIETYYRASAEVFEFRHGETGGSEEVKRLREALDALAKVGVEVKMDEKTVEKLAELDGEMGKVGLPKELEERISGIDDVGFFTKSKMSELAQMALMSDKQFDKLISSWEEFRDLMTKAVVKKPVKS